MQTPISWTASSADIIPDIQDFSALVGRWNEAVEVHVSSPFKVTYGSCYVQSIPHDPCSSAERSIELR